MQPAGADGLNGGDCLEAAGRAETVANEGLGAVDLDARHAGEHLLYRLHLCHVTHQRARRVRIDVVHLLTRAQHSSAVLSLFWDLNRFVV